MDALTAAIDTADIDITDRLARKAGKLRAAVDYTTMELDNLIPFLPDGYNRALIKDLRAYLRTVTETIDSGE